MIDTIINTIKATIPDVMAIYLFGSMASGNFTNDSDIDIAVLTHKEIEKQTLTTAKNQLSQTLNRDIDLIDLVSASTVFQYEILTSAKRIFEISKDQVDPIEIKMMALYLDFQEMRQDLVDHIQKRGSVYE